MHLTQSSFPFLHRLADAAGEVILPVFRSEMAVSSKTAKADGYFDPVTDADRNAELAMRALINEQFPDHGILGEEFGPENADAEYVWVLDPIDGTRAFISGLPLWGVLIGLRHRAEPAVGMLAQPYLGERFFGDVSGSFLTRGNQTTKINTRACASISEMSLSTTSPQMFGEDEIRRFHTVADQVQLLRYGYDCYAYAMLAMGFIDCVIEAGLQPYDIEPLVPVIEGAGGCVTDWDGNRKQGGGQAVAVGDRRLLEPVLKLLVDG